MKASLLFIGVNLAILSGWIVLLLTTTNATVRLRAQSVSIVKTSIDEDEQLNDLNDNGNRNNNADQKNENEDISNEEDELSSSFSEVQDEATTESSSIGKGLDGEWAKNVCEAPKDSVCHEVFVVENKKVTFCSAAKVASTTTKQYFFDISDGGVEIPEGAKFGVHEANWQKLDGMDDTMRKAALENESEEWTHVFFWKHVVERFVSGYLDKVVKICNRNVTIAPQMVVSHYVQFGFSCDEHVDFEEFVLFMETVPKLEGHFAPQTPLCNIQKYPFTEIIRVDENLSLKLVDLSSKLGVEHPAENGQSRRHRTGAKEKMVDLFKGKAYLIDKILDMFHEDCANIPEACDVDDLMAALQEE